MLERLLREQAISQGDMDAMARAFSEVGLSAQMISMLRKHSPTHAADQSYDSMDASTLVSIPKPMFEFDETRSEFAEDGPHGLDQSQGSQSLDGDYQSIDGDAGPSNQWVNSHGTQGTQVDDSIIKQIEITTGYGDDGLPAKFENVAELARGGVGVIHVVKDRELMRTLVAKTLIDGNEADEYVLKKFIEEAQITAQLEHPNIIPVHEFGRYASGEVFFTMKLIEGRTLKDVLSKLRKKDIETAELFGRTRLMNIFRSVCMAIGFAHSRGVIHRDIKPSNIMVGEYGEVLVLDWGVAKVVGRDDALSHLDDSVQTKRSASGDSTMMGLITGTPSYMPPEQAAGRVDKLDQRSDIYALGALLYEILTLKPPYREKKHRDTLRAVIEKPLIPPSRRAPDQNIPALLEEVCLRCLQKKPKNRYDSVKELVDDLMRYLSGVEDLDRRIKLAEARLEDGLSRVGEYHEARAIAMESRDGLMDLEWEIPGYAPIEAKRLLWDAQARSETSERKMQRAFTEAVTTLVEAIGFNPNNTEACNELARLYWYAMRDAENEGDREAILRYRALVATYDRGLYTEQLKGEGRLNLRSQPPGALVTASRYHVSDRRMRTGAGEALGATDLSAHILPEGDWLLTLSAPGYRDVRLPLQMVRAEVLDITCRFYTDEVIGQHYLHIPAGPFITGGDPACASSRLRRIENLHDFFISRYPVTCGEYLAFIRDIARKNPEEARIRLPRTREGGGQLWDITEGHYALPEVDRHGYRWQPHWPIFGVSFDDAEAYTRWYTERTNTPVRLPSELEWEKSARGTDGRWYPWGFEFDASFCRMARTHQGSPSPDRVGSHRTDRSPYGVYDMAGLIREYCDSAFDSDDALRVVKGGSYMTTGDVGCRVTHRQAVLRNIPSLEHGFRLVRDVPEHTSDSRRRRVRPQL